ncbi:MAG: CPBP family glutamic-type intramembrane protease [Opitutaceae bacterium]
MPPRVNACETAPDLAVAGYCLLCGRSACGWASLPEVAEPSVPKPWRCESCYRLLPRGAMYCGSCGRRARHEEVDTLREEHRRSGRFCAQAIADLSAPAAAAKTFDTDRELQPVREVGVFYAVMILPVLVLYGWAFHFGRPSLWTTSVVDVIFYGLIVGFACHWRTLVGPLLFSPPRHAREIAPVVVLAPLLTLAAAGLSAWLINPLLQSPELRYSEPFLKTGYGWWPVFISVAVCPAIFEEIAFRGIILKKLEAVMPPAQALLVTALLFAIMHYNLLGFVIFLVPLALAAGWTVQKSGSLWPAMLIHFLHNSGVVLMEKLHS